MEASAYKDELIRVDGMSEEEGSVRGSKVTTNSVQTVFNLINANVGTGVLCMPYAVHIGGYWSVAAITFVALLGNYTSKCIVSLLYEEDENGERARVRESYADIGEAFHKRYGRCMVHGVNCLEQFSHCILLLIMPGTVAANAFPQSGIHGSFWTLIFSVIVVPTIFLRRMKQVTWTSILSVSLAVVLCTLFILYTQLTGLKISHVRLPKGKIETFPIGLGIIIVTYASQPYLPSIERCMENPEKFKILSNVSYTIVLFFKLIVGLVVYFIYQDQTEQIMTLNLPHNAFGTAMNIAAIILALSFFTIPMFTVFDIIENQMFNNEKFGEIIKSDVYYFGVKCFTADFFLRLFLISMFITIASLLPYFSLFMSLVGNASGTTLVFIYPTLFYGKIRYNELSTLAFLVNGVIFMGAVCCGLYGTVTSGLALYSVYTKCDWSIDCHHRMF